MYKIKLNLIALIFLTFGLAEGNAQFSVKKNELGKDILQEKTIYFEVKELSEKQINKFKDQRTIDNFKKQYKDENEILSNTLKDHWANGEKITSLSTEEIETRIENKQETWYISLNKHTDKFFDKRVHKRNYYFYYQHYIISLYKNKQKVISIPFVNDFISELDMYFAIDMMQEIVVEIEKMGNLKEYTKTINQNSSLIKQKTLLIPQSYTVYTEEYINNYYKGNVKVVKEKEIIEALNRNDKKYAYLLVNINHTSEKPTFNHFILDCATNKPLFLYRQSGSYSKTGIQKSNMPVLKREIQFLLVSHLRKYNSNI